MAILFSLGPSFNRPYRRDIELRWTSNDQQTPWYHLTLKVPSTRPTASTGGSIINERLEKTRICGQMNAVCDMIYQFERFFFRADALSICVGTSAKNQSI